MFGTHLAYGVQRQVELGVVSNATPLLSSFRGLLSGAGWCVLPLYESEGNVLSLYVNLTSL